MKYFITVTGTSMRHGTEFMKQGMKVQLIKEPENDYDKEAIRVEIDGIGRIGYVANSVRTVIGDCMSAGRLYDKIGNKAKARVEYVLPNALVCRVRKKDILCVPEVEAYKGDALQIDEAVCESSDSDPDDICPDGDILRF